MDRIKLVPADLERLRLEMRIALSVTPRHVFKALWEPRGRERDRYREELVSRLTDRWEAKGLMEPERDAVGRTIAEG